MHEQLIKSGDDSKMVFEDYFDKVIGNRSFHKRPDQITILREDYEALKEKLEAISSQSETLKLENKELKDVLKDMKEDARKYKELREENEKYLKSLLRMRADFENYKKITERDKKNYRLYATEGILLKMIKHYDDLNRSREVLEKVESGESLKKGFEMIVKNLEKILEEEGVKPMNCEGEIFDPYKQEALMCLESNLPENTIIEELDKGYFFNGKVLRPAKVVVSKNSNSCKKHEKNNKIK